MPFPNCLWRKMVSRQFRVILRIFGVTYMAYHWKISGISYSHIATKSHHFELLNSCYDRLKSKTTTLLKDFVFKASFKSLSGIHFKYNFTVKSSFVPTCLLYSRQCKCRVVNDKAIISGNRRPTKYILMLPFLNGHTKLEHYWERHIQQDTKARW